MLSLVTAPAVEPVIVAEARRHALLNATAGEPAPTAPTVALADPAAPGDCDNGTHRVGITFVTADGETEIGPLSGPVTVADKSVNGQIAVTAIALGGSAVTSRRVYLTPAAGGAAKLAATIANNVATSVTLNVADGALGVEAPTTNTTIDPELARMITAARDRAELATRRALITQTWDWILDSFPAEGCLEVPKPPLQSVTIEYRDTAGVLQTWDAANYVVDAPAGPRARRGRISLAYGVSWPQTLGQAGDVRIRIVCGYGDTAADVPAILRTAILIDAARLYQHREGVIVGTSVVEVPGSSSAIYQSYRSYPRRRLAA